MLLNTGPRRPAARANAGIPGEKYSGGATARFPACSAVNAAIGTREIIKPAAIAVTATARPSMPRAINRAARSATIGAVTRKTKRRKPQEPGAQRSEECERCEIRQRRRPPRHQDRHRRKRGEHEERPVGRQVRGLQFRDVQDLRHVPVLEQVALEPPPIRVGHGRERRAAASAIALRASRLGRADGRTNSAQAKTPTSSTPKMHSTCRLLHSATTGIAHLSGAAVPSRRARSTSSVHEAIPANDATCGRGIARGSTTKNPTIRTASAAATAARARHARYTSTKISATSAPWRSWIPTPSAEFPRDVGGEVVEPRSVGLRVIGIDEAEDVGANEPPRGILTAWAR